MFRRFFLSLLAIVMTGFVFSGHETYSRNMDDSLKLSEEQFERIEKVLSTSFPNYSLMDTIIGDLNLDKEMDCMVVLEEQYDSDDLSASTKRKTVLLLCKNGIISIVSTNDFIIDCKNCGGGGVGDSYYRPVIANGLIRFISLFGDCDKTRYNIQFMYNEFNADWELFRILKEEYSCKFDGDEPEIKTEVTTRINFGHVSFSSFVFE